MSFTTVATELPRDRWGRPLITPPEGGEPVAYQRVTTFVKAVDDTYFLTQWQKRMVALGMAGRRDLVLAVAAITDPDDRYQKRTLNDIAESAVEAAKGKARATIGTALHSLTEVLDRGQELGDNVPEEYVADLGVYTNIVRYLGKPVSMEGFVVVDHLRVGGSYDRVWEFTEEGLDLYEADFGRRMTYPDGEEVLPGDAIIGDLKTGKSVDFGIGAISMQLGTYANGEGYDHTLGTRTPVPITRRDWGVVIHLPAGSGKAELVWVDLAAGWEVAENILPLVHSWRKRKDLSETFARASVDAVTEVSLVELINAATSYEALGAIYAANGTRWTPGLTALAKARTEALKAAKG